jgi:hypothetical protein
MRVRARQLLPILLVAVASGAVRAQVVWQPTPPPLVTAENEPWYLAAEPIVWSGTYYYPVGAQVFFNGRQMVRSGSFRGIPLYTDATRDPFSVVYVPLANGLMQPYERRRTGQFAGTTGNVAPSLPTDIGAEGRFATEGIAVDLAQNPGPPDVARPYDVAALGTEETRATKTVDADVLATAGRSITLAPRSGVQTAARPKGLNGVWVTFDDRRWFVAGMARTFDAHEFTERGSYHGFPVYTRRGEPATIYIPSASGLVVPYSYRK